MSSPEFEEEVFNEESGEDEKLFLLIVLYALHLLLVICATSWIYPPDEPPKNAKIRPFFVTTANSRLTGQTVLPRVHMTVSDIARLNSLDLKSPFPERAHRLSEEEQKMMMTMRDGEVHFLRSHVALYDDVSLNYGSLLVKRPPVEAKSVKEQVDAPENEAVVETLAPLKRPRALEKEKKRKNKERMDALDKLTRGESKEHQTAFKLLRIPSRHANSRRLPRAPSTLRAPGETSMTQSGADDDKTLQRQRKVSAAKGFTNLTAFEQPTPARSPAPPGGLKEKEEKTLVLAKTVEEPPQLTTMTAPLKK